MVASEEIQVDSLYLEESVSKIGKDVLKYAPSKIIGTIINLMLVSIYTSLLTPAQYGLYNIAVSVLSFMCIIFSDWIGNASLRFFKEHYNSNDIKKYFSNLLFMLILNLGIMYVTGFLLFKPICKFFNIPHKLFFLVLLLIIPVAIRALLFQIFRAQIKPLSYTIFVIINQLLTTALAIFFIKQFNLGTTAIILSMAISIIFIDGAMLIYNRITKHIYFEKIDLKTLSKFYYYGIPIAISSHGFWLISQSNKFILQHYKGSYYNGILGVSFNLTYSIVLPLLATITLAAIPRIINKYEEGKEVNAIITRLTGYYFMVFTPIILILCLFPNNMVSLFSNKNYAEAAFLIPFLAISVFIYGLTDYTTLQYHLIKKTYLETIIRIISGLIGVILNFILIPRFGLWGVSISTLTSNLSYLIFSLILRDEKLSWNPPLRVIKICFISVLICITAYFLMAKMFSPSNNYIFIVQASIISLVYIFSLKMFLRSSLFSKSD